LDSHLESAQRSSLNTVEVEAYLRDSRQRTLAEIRRHLPSNGRYSAGLYDVMLDYPLRPAKALRPALCMATCLAVGGSLDAGLPSAAALELFHNACLIHDDVEDAALVRRHAPALHVAHGIPVAINVGDAMLAVALEPLLHNTRVLGLGPALRIFSLFSRMARESVEGQMLELRWAREKRWDLRDQDYLRMVHKKTGWYSFIAPIQMGALAGAADAVAKARLSQFALCLGVAFQIQDDLLGLEAPVAELGKDPLGDLWEGKYTLALLHALRTGQRAECERAIEILKRARPPVAASLDEQASRAHLFDKLVAVASLTDAEREMLKHSLAGSGEGFRSEADIVWLHAFVTGREGASLRHARAIARRFARRAARLLERELATIPGSLHKAFLAGVVDYVVGRTH
jgi:geranylgeranyl diphosphate synthase type II